MAMLLLLLFWGSLAIKSANIKLESNSKWINPPFGLELVKAVKDPLGLIKTLKIDGFLSKETPKQLYEHVFNSNLLKDENVDIIKAELANHVHAPVRYVFDSGYSVSLYVLHRTYSAYKKLLGLG